MSNYNDAQGVADLLSQFDFDILNEGPGDFSPSLSEAAKECREASAAITDNTSHGNRAQDAR